MWGSLLLSNYANLWSFGWQKASVFSKSWHTLLSYLVAGPCLAPPPLPPPPPLPSPPPFPPPPPPPPSQHTHTHPALVVISSHNVLGKWYMRKVWNWFSCLLQILMCWKSPDKSRRGEAEQDKTNEAEPRQEGVPGCKVLDNIVLKTPRWTIQLISPIAAYIR